MPDKATLKSFRPPLRLGPGVHDLAELDPLLEGWYAPKDREVILSFVVSLDQGKGHLTGLLARWMGEYDVIKVPTPSGRMRGICERRGFKSEDVWAPEFADYVECMVWRKPK